VIQITCIQCGETKDVEPGRGRTRYFCQDKCRLRAYRAEKGSDRVADEYALKRAAIDKQYIEARRTSVAPSALRRRAMSSLADSSWPVADIASLFKVSEQRVRSILRKEKVVNGKRK